MPKINCPTCGTVIVFSQESGRTVRCPKCNSQHTIELAPFISPVNAKRIIFAAAAIIVLGCIVGWWAYLSASWESRHHDEMATALDSVEQSIAARQVDAAQTRYDGVIGLIGSHKLTDEALAARFPKDRESIAELKHQLDLERQTAAAREQEQAAKREQEQRDLQGRREENERAMAQSSNNPQQNKDALGIVSGSAWDDNGVIRGLDVYVTYRAATKDLTLQTASIGVKASADGLSPTLRSLAQIFADKSKKEEENAKSLPDISDTCHQLAESYAHNSMDCTHYAQQVEAAAGECCQLLDNAKEGSPIDLATIHRSIRRSELAVAAGADIAGLAQEVLKAHEGQSDVLGRYERLVAADAWWPAIINAHILAKDSTNIDARFKIGNIKPGSYYLYARNRTMEWFIPFEIKGGEQVTLDLQDKNSIK